MEKLYVAQREYEREGFEIIGIFKTKKEAEDCCANDKNEYGEECGDGHNVEDYKLGKNYGYKI